MIMSSLTDLPDLAREPLKSVLRTSQGLTIEAIYFKHTPLSRLNLIAEAIKHLQAAYAQQADDIIRELRKG